MIFRSCIVIAAAPFARRLAELAVSNPQGASPAERRAWALGSIMEFFKTDPDERCAWIASYASQWPELALSAQGAPGRIEKIASERPDLGGQSALRRRAVIWGAEVRCPYWLEECRGDGRLHWRWQGFHEFRNAVISGPLARVPMPVARRLCGMVLDELRREQEELSRGMPGSSFLSCVRSR